MHSNVHLCQFSHLADFVFIYPNVVLGNDRHPPSEKVVGPKIGSYTQIGIQSSIIGDINMDAADVATTIENLFPAFTNPQRTFLKRLVRLAQIGARAKLRNGG